MKLCVSKFILSFVLLLGLSRPLYAMKAEYVKNLLIVQESTVSHKLVLHFLGKTSIGIKFNKAEEMDDFINAMYVQAWKGSQATETLIATLPSENIIDYTFPEKPLDLVEGDFCYTVPTVFGFLSIKICLADGKEANTQRTILVNYDKKCSKPSTLPHGNLKDSDITIAGGILAFAHGIPGLVSKIPGEDNILSFNNTVVFYTVCLSTPDNIQAMDHTGKKSVNAIEDTFHSFTWKGNNILVRIDTIKQYCMTITPCSSSPLLVDPSANLPANPSHKPPANSSTNPPANIMWNCIGGCLFVGFLTGVICFFTRSKPHPEGPQLTVAEKSRMQNKGNSPRR